MRRHRAGCNLSAELGAAPHGAEKLAAFPQVGLFVEERGELALSPAVARLLDRFPTLRRHPHPMTVHFPLVFAFAAFVFAVLRVCGGRPSFATTALHSLWGGALCTPVAAATGFATWKLNYLGKPMAVVTWKLRLSLVLWALFCAGSVGPLVWGADGGAAAVLVGAGCAACAATLGKLGASLTFPAKK